MTSARPESIITPLSPDNRTEPVCPVAARFSSPVVAIIERPVAPTAVIDPLALNAIPLPDEISTLLAVDTSLTACVPSRPTVPPASRVTPAPFSAVTDTP